MSTPVASEVRVNKKLILAGFALGAFFEIVAISVAPRSFRAPYDEFFSFISSVFVVVTSLYFTYRMTDRIYLLPVAALLYSLTKLFDFLGSLPGLIYIYPIGDSYGVSNVTQSAMFVVAAMLLIYSMMLYIIDLRKAQNNLRESNAQLEAERARLVETNRELTWIRAMLEHVIESLPVGLFWKDSQGRYQGCNRRYLELTGAAISDPADMIGKTDQDVPGMLYRESSFGNGAVNGTWQVQTPTGSWHVLRRVPLKDEEKNDTGVLGVVADITNERLLAESQALLSRAIEQVDSLVAVFSERGTFVYANPAFCALTGLAADGLYGKPFSVLTNARLPEENLNQILRVVTASKSWKGRLMLRNAQNAFSCVDATVSPLWRSDGTLSHFVLIGHDVTREVMLEQQLNQAQRLEAIGRLAGGIAHDFNNMLQVVGGYTELMRAKLPADSGFQHALEVNARVIDRAARLVRQLMLFGRQDQSDITERFSLSSTVSNFLKLLRKVIGEHIEVRFESHLVDDVVLGQPEQVERVLLNLCVNARDAMPDGGTIVIKTTLYAPDTLLVEWPEGLRAESYYCLEVADTGTGIEPALLEHIFDPFFTTKEAGKGTGLGLSVAYSVMRQHQGAITVKSELNQGTTFYLLFPPYTGTEENADEIKQEGSAADLPGGSERILLVDDESHIRELCAQILRERGYTVVEAVDGEDGWRLFSAEPRGFDLVITDVVMPRLNGIMLRGRIHRERPEVPVILCSGYTPDVVGQMLTPEDSASLLRKPYTIASLLRRVRAELDGAMR